MFSWKFEQKYMWQKWWISSANDGIFPTKKTVSQGFNELRCCCCRWSGLDTYDLSDFRLKSEGMWGVYSYNIPIGDCILYTVVYRVINGWFILIKASIYLLEIDSYNHSFWNQRLMSNFTLPPPLCTSADGSGIASGVVLMPKKKPGNLPEVQLPCHLGGRLEPEPEILHPGLSLKRKNHLPPST